MTEMLLKFGDEEGTSEQDKIMNETFAHRRQNNKFGWKPMKMLLF